VSCSLVAWGEAGHAAAAKSQLAKQTAPFRGRVRARALARNLLEVRRMALPRARAVWSDETLDASERRRRIFMLWDECVESGDESVLATAASSELRLRASSITAFPRATRTASRLSSSIGERASGIEEAVRVPCAAFGFRGDDSSLSSHPSPSRYARESARPWSRKNSSSS